MNPKRTVFYYASRGEIFNRHARPAIDNVTLSREGEASPAVSADRALLFVREGDEGGELVLRSGDPPTECCFRTGMDPAFPSGSSGKRVPAASLRIAARTLRRGTPEGSYKYPEIVIGDPESEAEFRFPVRGVRASRVTSLSFDVGWPRDPYLYYETRDTPYVRPFALRGYRVYALGPPEKVARSRRGTIFTAPASASESSVDLLRIAQSTAGKVALDLVRVHLTESGDRADIQPTRPKLLTHLDGLDLDVSHPVKLELRYAGCLGVDVDNGSGPSFGVGSTPAWFVSDRKKLYLVDSKGRFAQIADAGVNAGIAPVPIPCVNDNS
ncbi:MAG: hypothetical protein M3290_02665 [Actinomycetota bacterium]|nr:hypothetical protein [Actinomycetota bacterium]